MISDAIATSFDHRPYPGGLTYSGHPLACAVGVETIKVFEDDQILKRVRDLGERVVRPELERWVQAHPSVGEIRGRGLFWAVELVRNKETREPLVPFNASGEAAAPMNVRGGVQEGRPVAIHALQPHACGASADYQRGRSAARALDHRRGAECRRRVRGLTGKDAAVGVEGRLAAQVGIQHG